MNWYGSWETRYDNAPFLIQRKARVMYVTLLLAVAVLMIKMVWDANTPGAEGIPYWLVNLAILGTLVSGVGMLRAGWYRLAANLVLVIVAVLLLLPSWFTGQGPTPETFFMSRARYVPVLLVACALFAERWVMLFVYVGSVSWVVFYWKVFCAHLPTQLADSVSLSVVESIVTFTLTALVAAAHHALVGQALGHTLTQLARGREMREELEKMVIDRTSELNSARRMAEQAAEAKGRFLANMSHEIRTPLHGMLGMADLLQRTSPSSRQRRQARLVQDAGEHLLGLLQEVLDASRIEAGRMPLDPQPTSLLNLMREVSRLMEPISAAKGLRLIWSMDPGVAPRVEVDSQRLRQVLMNLVGNAVKFTANGQVEIRLTHGGDSSQGQCVVVFEVADTGIGMTEAEQLYVFEPFVQADASTTRRFGGTGLGLTIARDLVEAMGGNLMVRSRLGEGSVFRFTLKLPIAAGSEGSNVPGSNLSKDRKTSRIPEIPDTRNSLPILVAEDNAINREVLDAMFELLGVEAKLVEDGEQALQALREGTWGLLLLDMHMPKRDGTSTMRVLAEWRSSTDPDLCQAANVPVVVLTADSFEEVRKRSGDFIILDHLAKPFRIDDLARIVSTHRRPFPGSGGPR